MKVYKNLLSELEQFGIKSELVIASADNIDSDLAMPCFTLAKEYKKSPQDIATDIASQISHPDIEKAEAIAGYVNIWLRSAYLADLTNRGEELPDNSGKTVIVEYLSNNLAKPLSIGHLRNILQGRALTNLHRRLGYNVITDNHIGDWGSVFGMWVVGFEKFSSKEQLDSDGNKGLGDVYIKMRRALKEEEEAGSTSLKDAVQNWLLKLEQDDPKAWIYHRMFSDISMEDTSRVISLLDVEFDETLGEAFYQKLARELLQCLVRDKIATIEQDGSIVVGLSAQGIDTPLLLQKSNGAALYATSDIATIKYREDRWNPDKVIYVVGAEQQFHFKQLFAFNRIVEYSDAQLIHHWYGLVEELDSEGNRSKMSSRSGAVYLEDALDQARKKAKEVAADGMSDDDIEKIALGALTFREFTQGHTSNVLFDWDEMFNLQGMSGPYLQYAAVRMASILEKANEMPKKHQDYDWQPEHELLSHYLRYPSVLEASEKEMEPSKIAFYLYDIAKALNRYYENTHILSEDPVERSSRLWLIQQLHTRYTEGLAILGIKVPSKM